MHACVYIFIFTSTYLCSDLHIYEDIYTYHMIALISLTSIFTSMSHQLYLSSIQIGLESDILGKQWR